MRISRMVIPTRRMMVKMTTKKIRTTRKRSLPRRYDCSTCTDFRANANVFQDDGAKPKQEAAECKQS
jgi:hypothetical protein